MVQAYREALKEAYSINLVNYSDKIINDKKYTESASDTTGHVRAYTSIDKHLINMETNEADQEVTATFSVGEAESFSTDQLPQSFYNDHTQEGGVFYDLLPLGYKIDIDSVEAASHLFFDGSSYNHFERVYSRRHKADVTADILDQDYKTSGRQYVKFTVKSKAGAHNNWYS